MKRWCSAYELAKKLKDIVVVIEIMVWCFESGQGDIKGSIVTDLGSSV